MGKSLLLHGWVLNLWEDGLAVSHQWEPLSSVPKNGLAASHQWDALISSPRESFVNESLHLPGEGAWGSDGWVPALACALITLCFLTLDLSWLACVVTPIS